ncbi:MAG: hypothetical protein HWN66_02845 [Candidatus Helarchaeota archaeon]|nr:hypothetical protein [Candidatus Helarchaeota archaeon]
MNLKEILNEIKEKLGLNGTFKWAVIGSLVIIILGLIILTINKALWDVAGFTDEDIYRFQMTLIALAGLLFPGILLGVSILGTHISEKEKIFGIIITALSISLAVMSIFLISYTLGRYTPKTEFLSYYRGIMACIIIADGMLALCIFAGIKNILDSRSKP